MSLLTGAKVEASCSCGSKLKVDSDSHKWVLGIVEMWHAGHPHAHVEVVGHAGAVAPNYCSNCGATLLGWSHRPLPHGRCLLTKVERAS